MAKPDEPDNRPRPARPYHGPRPVSALVPALVRPAFRRRAPATAQVLADWEVIAGPAFAALAVPRRLSGGTLTIACTGPAALELQHLADQLIERVNTHLGTRVVARLRFVQGAPPPPPLATPPRVPTPHAAVAARAAVETLPEGGLRDALEALGRMVLSRGER